LLDHRLLDHRLLDHRLLDHRLLDHRLLDHRLLAHRITDCYIPGDTLTIVGIDHLSELNVILTVPDRSQPLENQDNPTRC